MLIEQNVDSDMSESGVGLAVRRCVTLSDRLWNLDWSAELPWVFDGISVECSTFGVIQPFVAAHYPDIFGGDAARFLNEGMTDAKRRFWDETDVFAFRDRGRLVGVTAAHPTDWSTYYIRTFALLPEFRERRVATAFSHAVSSSLQSVGVARLEAECSPANTPMVRLFTSEGYIVTGTVNSERWGTMLRFTKFLSEDAKAAYQQHFLCVPAFGRTPKPK